jgi:hypothetical protein
MRAEKLKELIDGITGLGYEIVQIQPEYIQCVSNAVKHLTGGYKISITPIKRDDDEQN